MDKIQWDDKFKIGVESIDSAHIKLFRIFKKLIQLSEDPDSNQQTYKEGLKYLDTYSMSHFSIEEEYMRSIRYSGYTQHKRIHDNFRDKTLVSLKKDLELSGYSPQAIQRFAGIMSNWLAEHIMKEDQAIVGRTTASKSLDLSSQIAIISKAVNQAMDEAFQAEATLITSDYKGQNIGPSLYSSQFFKTQGGIRLQLLLGVEESLIQRGICRLTEMKMVSEEETPKETTVKIFDQLFQNLSKIFRAKAESELTKNNMLSRDAFRADFMKGYPCRLLYSSKSGYFIFCYRSWRINPQKTKPEGS